jgi:LmbE family N-acetylglucosaminyl deacetylase
MPGIYNVVSPHLDDAALSCALFLAANPGSRIITIFAAGPRSVSPLTPWDRAAHYFTDGADVTAVRRSEDVKAANLLQASARHLPYWDRQYRNQRYGYDGADEQDLAPMIADELRDRGQAERGGAWVLPLGLGHPDHRLAAEAGLRCVSAIWAGDGAADVYVYEELPYAIEDPADVAARKRDLLEHGFALEADGDLEFLGDRKLKTAVLRCHASQRRTLRRRARAAVRTPERIWRLTRR